jgi:hypothetical protein
MREITLLRLGGYTVWHGCMQKSETLAVRLDVGVVKRRAEVGEAAGRSVVVCV